MNQVAAKKPLRMIFLIAIAIIAGYVLVFKTNFLRTPPRTVTEGEWQPMANVTLGNGLVGVAFTTTGDAGAILANNGQVMLSQDGGVHWRQTSTALEDGEI